MISAQRSPTLWSITTAAAAEAVSSFFSPLVRIWSLLTDDGRAKGNSMDEAALKDALSRITRLEEEVASLRSVPQPLIWDVVEVNLQELPGMTVSNPGATRTRRRA